MHELSIALSIIVGASEEARKHAGATVEAVHLKVGALSGVVKDALLFSWEVASTGTILENSRLEIEEIPVVVFCENCQSKKTLDVINNFVCPTCDQPTPNIVSGRELQVTALEII
jgi:hydrogenase nickel incorporation protein HypA/HybF